MYRTKLCLGLSSQFGLPFDAQIRLMRRIGFEGFFSNWSPDHDPAALRSVANETGMMYQSIHAPFGKMADMWNPTEKTETAVSELLSCLRDCADNKVDIMVVHAFIGFEDHSPTAFGVDNFGRIVSEAEKLGVKIAFENTEGEEYLAALDDHTSVLVADGAEIGDRNAVVKIRANARNADLARGEERNVSVAERCISV